VENDLALSEEVEVNLQGGHDPRTGALLFSGIIVPKSSPS
jgi:hypothetical protein